MFKYKFLSIILVILLLLTTVGCGKKTEDAYIYFELPETPTAIDPQTASSDTELLIVRNIFEGLMRKDENGEIVLGAAKEYTKNGLSYTFTLRDDMYWSNQEKVTAEDFVFGFQRALNPETKAPFASRLFAISNAEEISKGKLSPEKLGVKALSEKKLLITLSFNDPCFLENLSTSVSMPCNEKFFKESAGKYGLFSDKILSNGSYRLTKWNKESFGIRLYKNEGYNGDYKAKNAAVFLTCNSDEPVTQKLIDNNIDISFIDCALSTDMEAKGFKTESFQNICWVMTLNDDFSLGMRTSLLKLVGKDLYANNLKSGYSLADTIFPEISNAKVNGIGVTAYDLEGGKNLYSSEVKKLENSKFPSDVKLIYYDNGFVKPIITDIVGHWQSNLSAFVNIETVNNPDTLLPQLKNQTRQITVFPVRADSKNNEEYLIKYGVTFADLKEAQSNILKTKNIHPLFFQSTTLCYSSEIKKIFLTEDNGFIDFAFVVKED